MRRKPGHPESFDDLAKANSLAPDPPGRPRHGDQARRLPRGRRQARALPTPRRHLAPVRQHAADRRPHRLRPSRSSTGEGFADLSGRSTASPATRRGTLYASVVQRRRVEVDRPGRHWTSIGDGLPTQVVWPSPGRRRGGGTLVVAHRRRHVRRRHLRAAWASTVRPTAARSWQHATGVPDGLLGFKIAVDPTNPNVVYAATGARPVPLDRRRRDASPTSTCPTGSAAPRAPELHRQVRTPRTASSPTWSPTSSSRARQRADARARKPGAVLAAVGWRAGTKTNADGAHAVAEQRHLRLGHAARPARSSTSTGGTSRSLGRRTQAQIGRIALGIADGADQDHNVVYAWWRTPSSSTAASTGLDVDEPAAPTAAEHLPERRLRLDRLREDAGSSCEGVAASTPTHRAARRSPRRLQAPAELLPGRPGLVQRVGPARPDAHERLRRADAAAVRARGGLETRRGTPLDGGAPAHFKVVGRYFGTAARCSTRTNGLPVCPTANRHDADATTTAPRPARRSSGARTARAA